MADDLWAKLHSGLDRSLDDPAGSGGDDGTDLTLSVISALKKLEIVRN